MSQVSIVIPIYNAEKFLCRCLDSITAQTYGDFEVILINDGSKDSSAELCEGYCQKDKRFKLINQKNAGPSKARNRGIDEASGKYLAFVDSDDYIEPTMLEELYTAAEASSADLTICGFFTEADGETGDAYLSRYAPGTYQGEELKRIAVEAMDLNANGNIRPYSWIRFVRRDCMDSPRLRFNPAVYRSEDYLIWNIFFSRIKSLCLITDKPLYHYVTNQTSITHRYIENYWGMSKTIYNELKRVYADDKTAGEYLNIMLIRRAYMSLHIAALTDNIKRFRSDMRAVLCDKELHRAVDEIPLKRGAKTANARYILLKFHLYFVIRLASFLKYLKSKNNKLK